MHFCMSFDLQLSNFGMDVEQLKKPTITKKFCAWLEDWEKDLIQVNDCVVEARLLEEYKDFLFFDPDTGKTYKVWGGNLEFYRGSQRTVVEKGWV